MFIKLPKIIVFFLVGLLLHTPAFAQQDDDLSNLLNDSDSAKKEYVFATFKTSRIINNHSIENTAKGVLDFRISHRFSPISGGIHDFFGLDGATLRLGLDYGIADRITIGVGRSSLYKEYDGYVKAKILRQTEKDENPLSISYVGGMSATSLPANQLLGRQLVAPEKYPFSNRIFYFNQILLARKFSKNFSLQLMPSHVHYNFVSTIAEPNDIFALGTGASISITKRTTLNLEYIYQFSKLNGSTNSLSVGVDIETGGHVFQLHFTNSMGMTERTFIGQTTDKWQDGGFRFGFNIARVFTIVKPREFENSRNKIW